MTNTKTSCNILGIIFFFVLTLMESVSFCIIFGPEVGEPSMIKFGIVSLSTLFFNAGVWFFAITYYKTLQNTHQ